MTDVPACAGRGTQARCRFYEWNAPLHHCTALYNVVTGEPLLRQCEDVRGDQDTCGRKGALYKPVEAKPVVATSGKFWVKAPLPTASERRAGPAEGWVADLSVVTDDDLKSELKRRDLARSQNLLGSS